MSERIVLELSERTLETVLVEWIELVAESSAESIVDDDNDDPEWEAIAAREALGDALRPDGSIDFDKLRARGKPMTLEELLHKNEKNEPNPAS